jgi:hypothetical protein
MEDIRIVLIIVDSYSCTRRSTPGGIRRTRGNYFCEHHPKMEISIFHFHAFLLSIPIGGIFLKFLIIISLGFVDVSI